MSTRNFIEHAWNRLARRAAQAPPDAADLPFGFAARVVAAWRSSPGEGFFAALEGLTWRGLAVAVAIFCGCAAFGYDSVLNAMSGDAAQAGDFLSDWLGL